MYFSPYFLVDKNRDLRVCFQMQPLKPWISRCNSDCTHILGCVRCDVFYCFGRGAKPLDDGFMLASALYVTNIVAGEHGMCWCRCGILVGVRSEGVVILIKYKTHWIRPDTDQNSGAVSDWTNEINAGNSNFWACKG